MQMIQQIQTLAASVEELTKQNEELWQRLSQENSNMPPRQCNQNNDDEEGHSPWTSNREESSMWIEQSGSRRIGQSSSRQTIQPNRNNDKLLKCMRKEMNEMKNAM